MPTDFQALEQQILADFRASKKKQRRRYPQELYTLALNLRQQGIPVRTIVDRVLKIPEFSHLSFQALNATLCRYIRKANNR